MAIRCPDAKPAGMAALKDWKLVFRTHATIEPCEVRVVPVLIWEISEKDEKNLKIAPTIVEATADCQIMEDEIFGPLLPILTYETINDVITFVSSKPKPLSLYIFSENKENINRITERISYGGGCINDVIIHLATSEMGFGGVGESGMGQYHGKAGFDAFSHSKSIVNKKTWLDLPMRYQPYKKGFMEKLLRMFLK